MGLWNRISRKSVSSSSSGGDNSSIPSTPVSPLAPAAGESSRPTKTSDRLAKTLGLRPKAAATEQRPAGKIVHPADRPLTETNLRHQELLSTFTFKFGRRRSSAGRRSTYSNVSPRHSRPASFDGTGDVHHHLHRHSAAHTDMDRRGELAGEGWSTERDTRRAVLDSVLALIERPQRNSAPKDCWRLGGRAAFGLGHWLVVLPANSKAAFGS